MDKKWLCTIGCSNIVAQGFFEVLYTIGNKTYLKVVKAHNKYPFHHFGRMLDTLSIGFYEILTLVIFWNNLLYKNELD